MRIAVVILNWNTENYLRSFVPGIIDSLGSEDALYVADSGSSDASLVMLQTLFPEVHCIALGENYGFAGGYNRALSQIDAEYYLLLNSDVEVEKGWIEHLVSWMEMHPECGVCGPKLHALDVNDDGSFSKTCRFEYAGAAGGFIDYFGYPYCNGRVLKKVECDNGQYDNYSRVFWVTGAALMIRSAVWKEVEGFDDRFFAHMEEIDLCWRVQSSGYTVNVVPQSIVYHIGGGTLPNDSPFKLRLNYRNSLWMLKKNLPSAIGPFRAKCRIAFRWFLDWLSALAYLFSGKKSFFQSVFDAHSEVRKTAIKPEKAVVRVSPGKKLILLSYLFIKK